MPVVQHGQQPLLKRHGFAGMNDVSGASTQVELTLPADC